jgi:hypothetical protein
MNTKHIIPYIISYTAVGLSSAIILIKHTSKGDSSGDATLGAGFIGLTFIAAWPLTLPLFLLYTIKDRYKYRKMAKRTRKLNDTNPDNNIS